MPSVLFVCRANQFRSPIAAACLKQVVQRDFPEESWFIGSAGTWAEEGLSAPPVTLETASDLGLPGLEKHSTRQVSARLLAAADLVIVMESGQAEALRYEFPSAAERVFQLSQVVDQVAYDIRDPDHFENAPKEAGNAICLLVDRGSDRILDLARRMYLERMS